MTNGSIKIAKDELVNKIENFNLTLGISQKEKEGFLMIKLGFTSFVGVIFTITFANQSNFSERFLLTLSFITCLTFLLLISEVWASFCEIEKVVEKQGRKIILTKIRHIVTLENPPSEKFLKYAQEAEELLVSEDKIRNKMLKDISLQEIIHDEKLTNKSWVFMCALWSLVFLSIPTLMLLKTLWQF